MRTLVLVLQAAVPNKALAQGTSQLNMTQVGEEAFQVIIQSYQYDKDIPLDARVVARNETSGYTREKITFHSVRDDRVPGYLAVPKNGSPPYPCVFLLHGAGRSKTVWWEGGDSPVSDLITRLHAAGFAVLALDAQYHGERIGSNDYEPWNRLFKRQWFHRMDEALIQSVIDYRRALDYLMTRKDINTQRIGVYGYSMGGAMTYLLTGVDQRIKVAVACVSGPGTRLAQRREAILPWNFTRKIRDRPIMMMMGRSDPLYTVARAEQFFSLIPSPTKELVWYESGHFLPLEHTEKVVSWLQKHLH